MSRFTKKLEQNFKAVSSPRSARLATPARRVRAPRLRYFLRARFSPFGRVGTEIKVSIGGDIHSPYELLCHFSAFEQTCG